jgi:hypothetical protein
MILDVFLSPLLSGKSVHWVFKEGSTGALVTTNVYAGSSKFASFSTCRRKTEGLMSRDVQISKIERKDGLVFPSSMRLMKARS